jgi:hypothetical protein
VTVIAGPVNDAPGLVLREAPVDGATDGWADAPVDADSEDPADEPAEAGVDAIANDGRALVEMLEPPPVPVLAPGDELLPPAHATTAVANMPARASEDTLLIALLHGS